MKARPPLVVTAVIIAALLIAIPLALPSRATVALTDLVPDTSLLPDPWNDLAFALDTVAAPYSYQSMQNVYASWEVSEGVWPYFAQWILKYRSPLSAALAFNILIPLATRSEPGIERYDPHWGYRSRYADQARTGCTDLGTGLPIRPETCTARLRYGQYVVLVTMAQPPVDETSFVNAVALVDEYVGARLDSD